MKRLTNKRRMLSLCSLTEPQIERLESRHLLTNVVDFSLEDVNSTSHSAGEMVSPLDYAGQTSAWYFGHAT
jgi:hypothetical protein